MIFTMICQNCVEEVVTLVNNAVEKYLRWDEDIKSTLTHIFLCFIEDLFIFMFFGKK